jgi:glycine/D-amino acid oxidase-like deaminating enzyme
VSAPHWTIVGQGLAGTCLAWELWQRGAKFLLVDREAGGSSRVAAGMINPVTGKNFEPSPRIAEFLPEALEFYQAVEKLTGKVVWHPLPVLRLAESEKEWHKMLVKSAQPDVRRWLANGGIPVETAGWLGALELTGGGRLDTRTFLDASRGFFRQLGFYQEAEVSPPGAGNRIWCEGATGLMSGKYGPHRCAKGEILTIRADGWDESRIRVGAGGWLVPLGNGLFKAGSTYEWNELDELPTEKGRGRVTEIINRLGGGSFEIIGHEAGIRPILRRSEPLIGPLGGGDWMFNALGSKGSLYAPGMARRLADWITEGTEAEPEFDFRHFSENRNP